MLNEIIEEYQHLLDRPPFANGPVAINEAEMIVLLQAAKLLVQIHKEADEGLIDGVDLAWICNVDELVLGIEEETL